MKFAFILNHTQFYRHFDNTIRILCGRGHSVDVVIQWVMKPNLTDRVLQTAQAEVSAVAFERPLSRHDTWGGILRPSRELINYSKYFHPEHPSKNLAGRWKKYFNGAAWNLLEKKWVILLLTSRPVQFILRFIERIAPPVNIISAWMKEHKPDLVIVSPLISAHSMELEYLKAAKALNIPSVYALASWDNLTTKGTLHILPDLVFVWNQMLLEEAVTLHGVPRERIVVTGSPTFDYWFETKPSISRDEFCRNAGFGAEKQYVVYLCSSRGMIEDETRFILELASQMKDEPGTCDVMLLVRPHPYNMLALDVLNRDNICVFPSQGDLPDVSEAKQIYFDTLHYAMAAAGVNTSAMLEAAIADKPCVTIIDERYRRSQTDMGHFRHLINGGFLQVTYSYPEAVKAINAIRNGQDPLKDHRRLFVKNFIRPQGVDRNVSKLFAVAAEMAAQRKTAAEIMDVISSEK